MILLRQKLYSFRTESPEEINLGNLVLKKTKDSWFAKHITWSIIKAVVRFFRIKDTREMETVADYRIIESGKHIGDLDITEMSKKELNVMWIEIDEKYRGRGYAQRVLSWVVQFAKERNYKSLTLEVPGISPDAKHIYEKLGFKEVGQITSPDEDSWWGGLMGMKLML